MGELTANNLRWRAKRLIGLGVVDESEVLELLRAGYDLARVAAESGEVKDYATAMRVIKSFCDLEVASRATEPDGEIIQATIADPTRTRLAAITARLAATSLVSGDVRAGAEGGDRGEDSIRDSDP